MDRLTPHSEGKRQSQLRDRHGNRANIFENQEEESFLILKHVPKIKKSQGGFYTARRHNQDLPDNYYPGPGSYFLKKYPSKNDNNLR